ncbi:MAG: PqqD family protein [Lachnospiraceae bacterium]|nr:PqqD family protein [Lachnospiraceae bacterium]
MITNLNQLTRKENVRLRRVENTFYIVCGKDCYETNETGALIVNAIGKDLSIDSVCEKLSDMYSYNDMEAIKTDVNEFVDFIMANNIAAEAASESF